jgi:ABC-type transport system involved in cytochrome c biogenesis permease subunit
VTTWLPTAALFAHLLAAALQVATLFSDRRTLRLAAVLCVGFGFGAQSVFLAQASWQAGYLPVTNLFSTLFFFSWALAGSYLYFELRYCIGAVGLFALGVAALLLFGALRQEPTLPPLIPALDTPLFTLHVACSFIGYAMFALAFSAGAASLVPTGLRPQRFPGREPLRRLNEEAVFLGFIFFSLCMISGSFWAAMAWGFWFSWNIKGVWSFIVWLFYGGMCHAKFIRRWQGTGYALLSIAGFAIVLFTYLGIGLLLDSNHPLR